MNRTNKIVKKIVLIGLLTALATAFSFVKIPIAGTATVNLVLPVVVIGAILCGPEVGAWLTIIPTLTTFGEASLFLQYSPAGAVLTLFLKGILAGLAAGIAYEALAEKHPKGAVLCAAVITPIVNSSIFVLGCYVFIWGELVVEANVGIGALLLGLAGINFVVELIINIVLCPSIIRIIRLASKKENAAKNGK